VSAEVERNGLFLLSVLGMAARLHPASHPIRNWLRGTKPLIPNRAPHLRTSASQADFDHRFFNDLKASGHSLGTPVYMTRRAPKCASLITHRVLYAAWSANFVALQRRCPCLPARQAARKICSEHIAPYQHISHPDSCRVLRDPTRPAHRACARGRVARDRPDPPPTSW
jgi:hypothetical protein